MFFIPYPFKMNAELNETINELKLWLRAEFGIDGTSPFRDLLHWPSVVLDPDKSYLVVSGSYREYLEFCVFKRVDPRGHRKPKMYCSIHTEKLDRRFTEVVFVGTWYYQDEGRLADIAQTYDKSELRYPEDFDLTGTDRRDSQAETEIYNVWNIDRRTKSRYNTR